MEKTELSDSLLPQPFSKLVVSYITANIVSAHITKQLVDRQKYPAKRRILNSLLGFCKWEQIPFFLFDILNVDMNLR